MDDERLPKRLFYGDVATGSRRQGGQIRRYMDTLKYSLKRLRINPTNWDELARDRPTWRRTVKTCTAIYEANRIDAAKVKREARKSQLHPEETDQFQLLQIQYVSKTAEIVMIVSTYLLHVHSSGLISMHQRLQDDCLVHL
nr:unnamed protein product [Spirometra erinaceieuropaei]